MMWFHTKNQHDFFFPYSSFKRAFPSIVFRMASLPFTTSVPASPLDVDVLNCRYSSRKGGWEELFDYGRLRYHLRLDPSKDGKGVQDDLLKQLGRAVDEDDDEQVDDCADECRRLMWSLVEHDYTSRSKHDESEIIKIEGQTVNGVLRPRQHDSYLKYPLTAPIQNLFPDVPTYPDHAVARLEELDREIFKVTVDDEILCMKTVHRTGHEANFVREISILQQCSHAFIIRLAGLVTNDDANIEAMLLEYVPNAETLRDRKRINSRELTRWTQQMKEAIDYLHNKGCVWGDAKPDNVLIRENGDLVLIDFGGGATSEWVEQKHYESITGDLLAWERIVNFMKTRVTQ
jgi:tRNA A-37 threonylcarbamoyl transferase component Bud32